LSIVHFPNILEASRKNGHSPKFLEVPFPF
jgi:hypothetical protein